MKFIDLFSGIGGIRLGLEQAGHECIGYCEVDKHALNSYRALFDTEGSWFSNNICEVNSGDLPKADLWAFGFPCTDISVAGKTKGFFNEDGTQTRSGLFFQVVRLLAGTKEEDKPRWLLIENVKNLLSIDGGIGIKGSGFLRLLLELEQVGYVCEWQLLNSKDFGVPQHRERVFIIGHLRGKCGPEVFPIQGASGQNTNALRQIGQSKWVNGSNCQAGRVYDKKGLSPTLKCPTGGGSTPCIVDDTYGYGGTRLYKNICPTLRSERSGLKVGIIDDQGRTQKDLKIQNVCPTLRAQSHGNEPKVLTVGNANPSGRGMNGNVYNSKGLAPTLTTNKGEGPKIITLGNYSPSGHNAARIVDINGIAPTVMENHGTVTAVKAVLTPDRVEKRQNGRRAKENGEPMFTLTSQDKHGVYIESGSSYVLRKLTPRECWRLQGFPDEYIDKVKAIGMSDSQMYKQAGNAVTVSVARAIGERLKEIENDICKSESQNN